MRNVQERAQEPDLLATKGRRGADSEGAPERSGGASGEAAPRGGRRWTAARREEAVLRLLRGESLEAVSRDAGVPVHRLEEWRERFLEGGRTALKSRPTTPGEEELRRAKAKIGELTMMIELHEKKVELRARRGRRGR